MSNDLVQNFSVNNLNELSTITRSGTLTVAGTTTVPATSVTVNGLAANHYADGTFALGGFTVTNGSNVFTAIGWDSVGNVSSNTVAAYLPATNNFAYDLNGNLTSDGLRGFDYNDENELIRVTATNSFKKEYVYDGKMRMRIRMEFSWNGGGWAETNEIHYIWDGNVILQIRNSNNVPVLAFTRGQDLSGTLQGAGGIGGMLAMTEGTGTSSYYHSDGIGNVMMLINSYQIPVAKYLYDPFGKPLADGGPKAFVNPIWYSSQIYDPDTGIVHYKYRAYFPDWDRFANRDPLGEEGGENLYQFIRNNPIGNFDLLEMRQPIAWHMPPISKKAPAQLHVTSRPATIRAGQLSLIIPNVSMPGPPTSGIVPVNLGKSSEPAIPGFPLLTG
jgi:RHS repeat-associated protein